jgi:cobalt/nickel transport protein
LIKKGLFFTAVLSAMAFAHFEVLYTPNTEIESGNEVKISSFFTHPFEGSPVMRRGMNEKGEVRGLKEVYVVHKGQKTDLTSATKQVEWTARDSKGEGSEITLSGANFKAGGDYAVVIVPHPYWEEEENCYIQQITKLLVNKGGFDTDWQNRVVDGYTEIIPLSNPYMMTKGQIFRAKVVDNEGEPAPGVTIEIRLLNYPVNQAKFIAASGKARTTDEKRGVNTVITDDNGVFAFVPQVAGFWGFAAISSGNEEEYNGKELEQDPVIWIKVDE